MAVQTHVMVDIRFLQDQYAARGIGRYGKEIISRLVRQAAWGKEVATRPGSLQLHLAGFGTLEQNLSLLGFHHPDSDLPNWQMNIHFHSAGRVKLSSPISNLLSYYTWLRPLTKKLSPDLFFGVHFDRGLPTDLVTTIAVVHDVIPLATSKFSSKGPVINWLKGVFYRHMWQKVKNAAKVLTCSQFSANDLRTYGGLRPSQIKVIYLGISAHFHQQRIPANGKIVYGTLAKYGLKTVVNNGAPEPVPYLFYDGGLEQNKNWPRLLRVFAKLVDYMPQLQLMITGADFATDLTKRQFYPQNERATRFMQMAGELGVDKQILATGKLPEIDMSIFLSQARAYINLSSYEGFGFGPVQAMAAGVPAIVSDQGSFPEICGDAAVVLPSDDDLNSAAKCIELLSSESLRTEKVKQGLQKAQDYSWHSTFIATWEIMRQLAEGRGKIIQLKMID